MLRGASRLELAGSSKPLRLQVTVAELRKRVAAGEKKAVLAAEYNVTRQTIYNALES